MLTRDLGPQTEQELQRQLEHEVDAERLTSLDRTLIGRAEAGIVDLRHKPATAFDRVRQQFLIAQARQLERMNLATQQEALRWSLRPDVADVLRTMGERGDILKTMHRAGKSWLACALGHKACRDNRSVLYQRIPKLLAALALACGDGRYARLLRTLGGVQLLVLDDWGLQKLDAVGRQDFLEVREERYDGGPRSSPAKSQSTDGTN